LKLEAIYEISSRANLMRLYGCPGKAACVADKLPVIPIQLEDSDINRVVGGVAKEDRVSI
jgi:hypothetical protein